MDVTPLALALAGSVEAIGLHRLPPALGRYCPTLPVATTSPRRWFCNESPHFCVAGAALAKAVFLTVARHAGYPPCNPLPHGNNNGNGNGRPGLEVLYLLALSDYALSLKRLVVWEKHVLSAGMAAGARARLPGRRPAPVPALTPHAAAAVARVLPLLQVTCPLAFVVLRFSRCPHRVLCCVLVASERVGATLG